MKASSYSLIMNKSKHASMLYEGLPNEKNYRSIQNESQGTSTAGSRPEAPICLKDRQASRNNLVAH